INYAKALERVGRFSEAEAVFKAVYEDFRGEQATLEYVNYLLRRHKEREAVAIIQMEHPHMQAGMAAQMLMAAASVTQKNGWGSGAAFLEDAYTREPRNPDVA